MERIVSFVLLLGVSYTPARLGRSSLFSLFVYPYEFVGRDIGLVNPIDCGVGE